MAASNWENSALEELLAGLLNYGTWLASGVVAVGLTLVLGERFVGISGLRVVTAGIALFILLPVLRVDLMLIAFVRERDYRFVTIASLVLLILWMGLALAWSCRAEGRIDLHGRHTKNVSVQASSNSALAHAREDGAN
jgi:hypothetical protein